MPPVFETLNENRAVRRRLGAQPIRFMHPLFTAEAIAAQKRLPEIQGDGGVWFAGAWQRYGFHEDGLLSAVRVAESLGAVVPWGDELDESRTRELSPAAEQGRRRRPRSPIAQPGPRDDLVNSRLYTGTVAPQAHASQGELVPLPGVLPLPRPRRTRRARCRPAPLLAQRTRADAAARPRSRPARRLAAAPVDRRGARARPTSTSRAGACAC